MNEIVNQHNDLIDLPLRRFNSSEIDILLALCYTCQEQGTKEIVLPFDKIRQRSHYQAKDDNRFYRDIESMGDKLFSLHMKVGTEREYTKFVLFPTFKVSEKEQTVTIAVNEKFTYLLNDLSGNYTALELQQSSHLKSAYSKAMYKKLRKFRDTGEWIVTLEDFKIYLDIPKSYGLSDINKRVLNPSIEELHPYFENLKVNPVTEKKNSGRGRPSVTGYRFTFKKQPHADPKEQEPLTQGKIAEQTGWKSTGKYCPRCKRPIFSSMQHNDNGSYTMYGHTDFKTGPCDYKTNDIADLLDEYQLADEEPVTEEQKENKKRLKDMFAGLFG